MRGRTLVLRLAIPQHGMLLTLLLLAQGHASGQPAPRGESGEGPRRLVLITNKRTPIEAASGAAELRVVPGRSEIVVSLGGVRRSATAVWAPDSDGWLEVSYLGQVDLGGGKAVGRLRIFQCHAELKDGLPAERAAQLKAEEQDVCGRPGRAGALEKWSVTFDPADRAKLAIGMPVTVLLESPFSGLQHFIRPREWVAFVARIPESRGTILERVARALQARLLRFFEAHEESKRANVEMTRLAGSIRGTEAAKGIDLAKLKGDMDDLWPSLAAYTDDSKNLRAWQATIARLGPEIRTLDKKASETGRLFVTKSHRLVAASAPGSVPLSKEWLDALERAIVKQEQDLVQNYLSNTATSRAEAERKAGESMRERRGELNTLKKKRDEALVGARVALGLPQRERELADTQQMLESNRPRMEKNNKELPARWNDVKIRYDKVRSSLPPNSRGALPELPGPSETALASLERASSGLDAYASAQNTALERLAQAVDRAARADAALARASLGVEALKRQAAHESAAALDAVKNPKADPLRTELDKLSKAIEQSGSDVGTVQERIDKLVEGPLKDAAFKKYLEQASEHLETAKWTFEKLKTLHDRAALLDDYARQIREGDPAFVLTTLDGVAPLLEYVPLRGGLLAQAFQYYTYTATKILERGRQIQDAVIERNLAAQVDRASSPERHLYTLEEVRGFGSGYDFTNKLNEVTTILQVRRVMALLAATTSRDVQ